MDVIGVDCHTRVHATVAVDDRGQEIGQWRGANTPAGGRRRRRGGSKARGNMGGAWRSDWCRTG